MEEAKIRFKCSNCGKGIKVSAQFANRPGICPNCKEVFIIPISSKDGKNCPYCGKEILKQSKKCKHCKQFLSNNQPSIASQNYNYSLSCDKQNSVNLEYAGLLKRAFASLLDAIVDLILITCAYFIACVTLEASATSNKYLFLGLNIKGLGFMYLLSLIFQWLYKAGLESSEKQGTFGKCALGIKVVNCDGERVSFARASFRYLMCVLINFIPVFSIISVSAVCWSDKKQTIYDMFCETVVIKN